MRVRNGSRFIARGSVLLMKQGIYLSG